MLKTYNEGVYFNAGMFYARIFNVLVPPVHAETEAETEAEVEVESEEEDEEDGPLYNKESPKQFAAGFLYAWSGQTIEERDNMLECEKDRWNGRIALKKAFKRFNKGNIDAANDKMNTYLELTRGAVRDCNDDITGGFYDIDNQLTSFYAQYNA